VTSFVLAVALAAAGVYDVYAAFRWGYSATLTAVVREYSSRWTIIPFLAGVLAGHLFAQ
jgi:hypothetical protein